MFQRWMDNLRNGGARSDEPEAYWVERLSALLLMEIARSDTHISEEEMAAIEQALQSSSNTMGPDEIHDIITTAVEDADNAVSLHEHFRQINAHFTKEQKHALIEQMWRVALADGDLDKYEEHTIRGLSERLHVKHREFIKAKLRVIPGSD